MKRFLLSVAAVMIAGSSFAGTPSVKYNDQTGTVVQDGTFAGVIVFPNGAGGSILKVVSSSGTFTISGSGGNLYMQSGTAAKIPLVTGTSIAFATNSGSATVSGSSNLSGTAARVSGTTPLPGAQVTGTVPAATNSGTAAHLSGTISSGQVDFSGGTDLNGGGITTSGEIDADTVSLDFLKDHATGEGLFDAGRIGFMDDATYIGRSDSGNPGLTIAGVSRINEAGSASLEYLSIGGGATSLNGTGIYLGSNNIIHDGGIVNVYAGNALYVGGSASDGNDADGWLTGNGNGLDFWTNTVFNFHGTIDFNNNGPQGVPYIRGVNGGSVDFTSLSQDISFSNDSNGTIIPLFNDDYQPGIEGFAPSGVIDLAIGNTVYRILVQQSP